MRVSMYIVLLIAGLLTVFGCSDSSSGDDGESNGDTTVVGLWNITSYSDGDGPGEYTGWLEYASDGTFDSSLKDEDYPAAFQISGTWSTSGSSLTLVVQESNDPWLPAGTYVWSYSISNNTLTMSITLDGDTIRMTFDKDTSAQTGTISGTVTVADRGPLAGVLVTVLTTSKTATTGSDGTYTITDVPIGSYSVMFSKDGYATQTKSGVQVVENQTATVNAQMAEGGEETGSMEGFVTDISNQTVLVGATITIEGTSFSATSDALGYYHIGNIPAGDYTAVCSKAGYQSDDAYVTIIAGDVTDVDFIMIEEGNEPYAILAGTITASGYGTPIDNVVVTIGEAGVGASDETGAYEAMVLTAGTYDVTFRRTGFEPYTASGVTFTIGETVDLDVEMTLYEEEATNTLQVYVSKEDLTPISGATVTLQGTSFTGTTSFLGFCTFDNVPVGVYRMDVEKSGYQSVEGRTIYVYSHQGTPAAVNVILEPGR